MTTRRKLLTVGCALGGVAVVALVSFTGMPATQPATSTVNAVFADASPLVPGFTVRSHGVKVGEVESLTVLGGKAWVALSIDDTAARPLHTDATAKIRPVSLLGERYIDFDRGTPSAPLAPAGALIDEAHTASAVDLSDVLDTVDKPTGTALAALLTTLGDGTRGRGRDVDATIAALAPSLRRTDGLVDILNQQNKTLAELIDRAAPVAGALASNQGRDLDQLLASTDLLLRTTTANQKALDEILRRLPRTLRDARGTLAQVSGVAEQGTGTLRGLRPFSDALPRITGELQGFSDAADPALDGLDPVLRHGRKLLNEADPLVRTLRPAGGNLRSVSASARPIVASLTSHVTDVMEFIRGWALSTSGFDGVSNYFRGTVIVDQSTATGLLPGGTPGILPKSSGPIDKTPVPKPPIPMLLGNDTGSTDQNNVTGLSPDQEHNMVGQLLGGG